MLSVLIRKFMRSCIFCPIWKLSNQNWVTCKLSFTCELRSIYGNGHGALGIRDQSCYPKHGLQPRTNPPPWVLHHGVAQPFNTREGSSGLKNSTEQRGALLDDSKGHYPSSRHYRTRKSSGIGLCLISVHA